MRPQRAPDRQDQHDADEVAGHRVQPGAQRRLVQAKAREHRRRSRRGRRSPAAPRSRSRRWAPCRSRSSARRRHRRSRPTNVSSAGVTGRFANSRRVSTVEIFRLMMRSKIPPASRCRSAYTLSAAMRREAASTTWMPLSKRPGCSQTVSAPTLVVSGPSSCCSAAIAAGRVAVDVAALDVRRQSPRQRNAAVADDDDARVAQARELADGAVDDPHAADAHARADRFDLGRAQDHRNDGGRRRAHRARREHGGRAGNRAKLSGAINHHANSVPSS